MSYGKTSLAVVAAAAFIVPMFAGTPAAFSQGVDFSGKKITFWTPHRGAGSILSQKTWGKYISKYLPGNPQITVKSKFGGGGVTNANFFEATAKPNGLSASMHNLPVFMSFALKRPGVKYDSTKWAVLGSEPANYIAIAGKASGVNSAAGIKKAPKTLSFGTRTRNFNVMTAEILWRAAGSPVKVTPGFGGDPTVIQALASGELELGYINFITFLRSRSTFNSLGIKGLYQVGLMDKGGNVVRAKNIDLPTANEVFDRLQPAAKGTPAQKAMYAGAQMWQIGKSYFLPKGTDGKIVDAWRTAMGKAIDDPEFQAEHQKLLGVPLGHIRYKQASELLDFTYKTLGTPFFQKGGEGYAMAIGDRKRRKKKK